MAGNSDGFRDRSLTLGGTVDSRFLIGTGSLAPVDRLTPRAKVAPVISIIERQLLFFRQGLP